MSTVRVTYRKSAIGYAWDQKATLGALGLKKLNHTVEHEASPSILGMGPQGQAPRRRERRARGSAGRRGAAP
jgi:large subunit ribosomal protein L30